MNHNITNQRFDQSDQAGTTPVPAAKGSPVLLAGGGSAALIGGLFMPWAESLWVSVSGIESPIGMPLLALGALAGFFAHRLSTGRRGGGFLILIGVLASLYTGGTILGIADDDSGMIVAGTGVWVSAVGAAMLVIAGLQARWLTSQGVPT